MIQFGSVVPERESQPYFIISQAWFTRWQKYTGCFKVEDGSDDEDDDVFPSKDKSGIVLGPYPSSINESFDIKNIAVPVRDVMYPADDIYGEFYLKSSAKEGKDF